MVPDNPPILPNIKTQFRGPTPLVGDPEALAIAPIWRMSQHMQFKTGKKKKKGKINN